MSASPISAVLEAIDSTAPTGKAPFTADSDASTGR
jgi:hypothetical protein